METKGRITDYVEKYENFFKFIGYSTIKDEDSGLIEDIKKIKEYKDFQRIRNHTEVKDVLNDKKWKGIMEYVLKPYTYDQDINVALYMLVGAVYAGIEENRLKRDIKNLPFVIKNNKQIAWCKIFSDLLINQTELSPLIGMTADRPKIKRYTYFNMRYLENEIRKNMHEKETKMKSGEFDCKHNMSLDGKENLISFDWLLGVSFAETCYEATKNKIKKSNLENVKEIIKSLSEIKSYTVRNIIAKGVLEKAILELEKAEYTNEKKNVNSDIEQLKKTVKIIIKAANTTYAAVLYHKWNTICCEVEEGCDWNIIMKECSFGIKAPVFSKRIAEIIYSDMGLIYVNPDFIEEIHELNVDSPREITLSDIHHIMKIEREMNDFHTKLRKLPCYDEEDFQRKIKELPYCNDIEFDEPYMNVPEIIKGDPSTEKRNICTRETDAAKLMLGKKTFDEIINMIKSYNKKQLEMSNKKDIRIDTKNFDGAKEAYGIIQYTVINATVKRLNIIIDDD